MQAALTITSIRDIQFAKAMGADLRTYKGTIQWGDRTYNVVSGALQRQQIGGLCSRVGNAIWDFFARGFSTTTRSKEMADIIFGREPVVLPVSVKRGEASEVFKELYGNLKTAGVDLTKVEVDPTTSVPEIYTSEGAAKNLKEHVVIRAWLNETHEITWGKYDIERPGHSAISVKTGKENLYLGLVGSQDGGTTPATYKADKQRFAEYNPASVSKESTLPPFYKNKAGLTAKKPSHEVSASSKIYLPLFGARHTKDAKPVNVLFGLSPSAIRDSMKSEIDGFKNHTRHYDRISKDSNCSGAAMQMMLAGGAGKFVRRPPADIYYMPIEVQQYARELQQCFDSMNAYTDDLLTVLEQENRPPKDIPESESSDLLVADGSTVKAAPENFLLTRGSRVPGQIKTLVASLASGFDGKSHEDLVASAKQLVDYLAKTLGDNPKKALAAMPAGSRKDDLMTIIRMVKSIREKVCEQSIEDAFED